MLKNKVNTLEQKIKAISSALQGNPAIVTYTAAAIHGKEMIYAFEDKLAFENIDDFKKHYKVKDNYIILIEVVGTTESVHYRDIIGNISDYTLCKG